ncbi:MAG: hypothetical protein WBF99_12620 [Xanthobacteraceae bacterium]
MQFKSRKPKPSTGLELSVTLMMPDGQSIEQSREAICAFFDRVTALSQDVGAAWLRINCSNIPAEFEPALQTALDKFNRKPNLELVVNNASDR